MRFKVSCGLLAHTRRIHGEAAARALTAKGPLAGRLPTADADDGSGDGQPPGSELAVKVPGGGLKARRHGGDSGEFSNGADHAHHGSDDVASAYGPSHGAGDVNDDDDGDEYDDDDDHDHADDHNESAENLAPLVGADPQWQRPAL